LGKRWPVFAVGATFARQEQFRPRTTAPERAERDRPRHAGRTLRATTLAKKQYRDSDAVPGTPGSTDPAHPVRHDPAHAERRGFRAAPCEPRDHRRTFRISDMFHPTERKKEK